MVTNVGTTPERWLQSLDRLVAASAALLPRLPVPTWRHERVSPRWILERGPVRASAPVDVIGGFPGSLRSSNHLQRTSVLVTDRYLVIGEGTHGGFALPVKDVLAAGLFRPSRQVNAGLVVQYQDGAVTGAFALNFRGLARGLSGGRRAEDVLRVLEDRGVRSLTPENTPGSMRLALSWQDARRYADEPLAWSGVAHASFGGWYGSLHGVCRVWLTEEALFWCCSEGTGVNRVAFNAIIEVSDGVADRIRLSIYDSAGCRCDLPFDFDTGTPGLDATRQRMQFLNLLASHGVAVRTAPVPLAPWRIAAIQRSAYRLQ